MLGCCVAQAVATVALNIRLPMLITVVVMKRGWGENQVAHTLWRQDIVPVPGTACPGLESVH